MSTLTARLLCHPATQTAAVRSVEACIERRGDVISLSFRLRGDLDALRIPAPSEPAIAHFLWQHTCFEAFVKIAGESSYHELNLAPSGEWVVYAFSGYREPSGLEDESLDPSIVARSSNDVLELDATIRLDLLSDRHARAPLQLALSAVVEDRQGNLSYWSLHHPPGAPDFHHPDTYQLSI